MEEIKLLTEEIKKWRDGQDEQIAAIRTLLLGNGKVGLCETVRGISSQMKALWTLVGVVGFALIGGMIKLFMK